MLPLVFLACLIQIRIQEFTRNIGLPLYNTLDRRPVDMDIKHAHEYRDPDQFFIAKTALSLKLDRRFHRHDQIHQTIGGRYDIFLVDRRYPFGVAEKCQHPYRDTSHRPRQRFPCHDPKKSGDKSGNDRELAAFWMNRRESPFGFSQPFV